MAGNALAAAKAEAAAWRQREDGSIAVTAERSQASPATSATAAAEVSQSHVFNLERDRKPIGNHWVERYAKVLCCEAAHIWAFADVLFTAGPSPDAEWLRLQYEEICTAPGKAFS